MPAGRVKTSRPCQSDRGQISKFSRHAVTLTGRTLERLGMHRRSLTFLLVWMSLVGDVAAATDAFRPFAEASIAYDSNLFRVSGAEEALRVFGTTDTSDTIGILGVGFDSDLSLSRQHVVLHANVDRYNYRQFTNLDYIGGRGNAVWNWRVGELWNGDIGYGYSQALSSFEYIHAPIKNIVEQQTARANATFQFNPRWQFTAAAGWLDLTNSALIQNDRLVTFGELETTFTSLAGTRVGLWGRVTDGEFPNREVVATSVIDNSYRETQLGVLGQWPATGHSELTGRVGYTVLEYPDLPQRNFAGPTGRLTYLWQITDKTRLNASLWHDIHWVNDETATYVLDNGGDIGASWSVTAKVQLRIDVESKRFDYLGDPGLVVSSLEPRVDTIKAAGVSLTYAPLQKIQFVVFYKATNRDSNRPNDAYQDRYASATVHIDF